MRAIGCRHLLCVSRATLLSDKRSGIGDRAIDHNPVRIRRPSFDLLMRFVLALRSRSREVVAPQRLAAYTCAVFHPRTVATCAARQHFIVRRVCDTTLVFLREVSGSYCIALRSYFRSTWCWTSVVPGGWCRWILSFCLASLRTLFCSPRSKEFFPEKINKTSRLSFF